MIIYTPLLGTCVSHRNPCIFFSEPVSMEHLPVLSKDKSGIGGASNNTLEAGHLSVPAGVCVCKRMCLGDPRAELWEGAVKSLSLQSESPLSPRPFPLTIGISWEDDLALFLVFVYFYLGESRPHRLLLPFLLYHHPLPVLSLH